VALIAGPLAPVTARAAAGPSVTIAPPASGTTATGLYSVTVTGQLDPTESDHVTAVALEVDGVVYVTKPCTGTTHDCDAVLTWDSTELNGAHSLDALLTTELHPAGVHSATLSVTAANPLPIVVVTSPAPGTVVKGGNLTVAATGTVELSQIDQPAALQLWVDGAKYGLPQPCNEPATTARLCHGSFTTSEPTWSGTHSFRVGMTTTLTTATSDAVPYDFYTGTRTSLQPVPAVRAGKRVGIRGSVVGLNAGAPVAGARVVVTIAAAFGKKKSVVLHTGSTGHFSLAATITANSTVTASVTGAADIGASHASAKVKALAPIVCKADLNVRHGRNGTGTCTVPHLPDGTTVSLQYQAKKKWHVLGSGTTRGTSIVISYKFGAAGKYPVRLVLGANKVYVATYGTPFVVKVS
jgi:hypothetical protein